MVQTWSILKLLTTSEIGKALMIGSMSESILTTEVASLDSKSVLDVTHLYLRAPAGQAVCVSATSSFSQIYDMPPVGNGRSG